MESLRFLNMICNRNDLGKNVLGGLHATTASGL